MKKKITIGLAIFILLASTAYAANNAANIINATANFINALNGQPIEGEYRHFNPISANNMSRPCFGRDARSWDDCIGVFVYPNGNIYSGEYRMGQRDGVGMIRVLARGVPDDHNIRSNVPSTYVGQFADNRINGVGTWTTDTGISFVGEYMNNSLVRILQE